MSFWLASPSSFFWSKLSHWSWTFLLCPELSGQKAAGLFLSLFPELALQLHTETGSFLVSVQELDSGLHVCKTKYLHYPLSHVPWPWTLSKDVKQGVVRGVAGESHQGKKKLHCLEPSQWGHVQSAKYFPHKHEDLSSDTQCPHMYQEATRHVYTPSTGEQRQGDAESSLTSRSRETSELCINGRLLYEKKLMGRVIRDISLWCPYAHTTCVHICTKAHTHSRMHTWAYTHISIRRECKDNSR